MFVKTKTPVVMLPKDKDIIIRGEWLTDIHMDHFNHLLKNCSDYRPVETWRIQCLDTIQPVPKDKKHIQILHSSSSLYDGHWVCSYYNTKNIFIYDSLNIKKLHKHHEEFLKRLFPTYAFENSVKFPTVQHQPNGNDCGVYAIAFAISLLFNIKPEKVKYNHSLMRLHLIKIFETNVIEHFPQDPQYTFQEVLPLVVIKAKEVEAIRLRTIRISQKLHIKNNDCKINSSKNVCNDNERNSITINEQICINKNNENKYIQKYFLSGDNNELEKNININKRKYDLENQCINKRLRYMQVLQDNLDKQDLESNHIRQHDLHKQNVEEKRAKKHDRYKQNIEEKRAKQRNYYKQNLEDKRAKKRDRYKQNSKDKCVKERYRYKADLENKRVRIRYSKDFQRERERQRKLNPDRKWLYNKRYYLKKRTKSISEIKETNIVQKINKKYVKFWSRNSIKICNSLKIFKVKDIVKKINIKGHIEKQLEAEKIIRWCMHIRNSHIRQIYKMLTLIRKKSEVNLTLVAECSTIDEKLRALCGISKHTASSENYFIDSTYRDITSSEPLIINTKGKVVNILPLIEGQIKKSWLCNTLCKIDKPLISRYQEFLKTINICTLKNVPKLIKSIHECTMKTKISNEKLGHTHSCYIDLTLCKGIFLPVQLLSPHFPKVRYIRRLIYQLISFYRKMENIDQALINADLNTLNKIVISAQEKVDMYKHQQFNTILSDDDIIFKYRKAFKAFIKRSKDTPRNICISCERLCYKRSVSEVNSFQIDNQFWKNLIAYIQQHKINAQYICNYCASKFRNGLMPAYCILNNLFTDNVPKVISSLNIFEKILIQRAKAYQTIFKMGTVINKKLPQRQMVQKVKGRTFHLPLPLQETLNKLCSITDPIDMNLEFYILVRSIPTKSKIIWEEIVDVKKVFDALMWLKRNNALYSHIILPNNYSELCLPKLKSSEFQMEEENNTETSNDKLEVLHKSVDETKNDMEIVLENQQQKAMLTQVTDEDLLLFTSRMNNEPEVLNKSVEETKNDVEVVLENQQQKGMLTQITNEDDSYYEQYTIYPLYEKKANKTATTLYQMLKIQELPLDNREKYLDLMCFPDIYPFGKNGQHETRKVKLYDHEFIKCRLTSKHPQYRLNQQYLFYLLNDANMRQLNRGIFHKMNVTNSRVRYTAAEYLDAMSKELLESNLSTIFSTLRNTEQYWRKPRSDLNCITQHYGPATWFLTLSPSEWLWEDLGEYIREVNGWHDVSLSVSVLVAKDPVSTSRFLDNKFRAMLDFITSEDHPIGEVIHYFWRREYQGRGIQHFHLLIWIKNAPIFGESVIEEVSKFILQHISCKMPDQNISPLLYRRVNTHQQHVHNDYCLRSKKVGRKVIRRCRFGFPRPVTETLNMRDVTTSIAGRKQLKHKSRLYDLPRMDNEVNINDYNPVLLTAWEGNMDIQFIGEKSSLLTWYITKYMNKAGKSELSEIILNSKNNKHKSLASYLWNIALRFTNNRECGALEAADALLSIPLYGTDQKTTIRWLDVNPIRYRKLKNRKEVEALDAESTNIFYPSLIDDHYPHRPNEIENMSLYEFAQWYDISKIKPKTKNIQYYKIDNGYYLKRRQRGYLINHYRYSVNTQPENYFFSLLLMFKPWRKLEDLRCECDTYAEAFHKIKLHLIQALQYHERLEELQKAFETAKQLVQQCLDDDLQKQQSQDDSDNPIGVQNVEAGEAMQDFKDLGDKVIREINISEMIEKLNTDQKRVFNKVINIIESDESVLRLYVSGEGGTGKSFLIKTIKCWIKQNMNKDTAVAAPTGIAAFNINGLTVHRLLQLPVEHGHTPKYKPLSDHVLKVLRADLKNVILFIIDEVSMISNLTLMYIHLRLSEIFDTNDCDDGWFGRKHILLFGDLLQLPPVREDPIFIHLSNEKVAKYLGSLNAVNLWITLFDYEELIINMRQQEDNCYRELLSKIRIGLLTKSDCKILESRKISFKNDSFESRVDELCSFINNLSLDTVCLLPTCNMCDVINNAMLNRIASKEILLTAEDTIECIPYVKKKVLKVLSNNDDDNSRTAGLSKQITIKIGVKVMIRRNIDASLGLVNGTIAKVISVEQDTFTDKIEKIKLLLPSGLEYSIERVSVKFEVIDRAYVIRKQFPLSLSYGITIHKSQGLSLQNAIMDIGNSVFSCGQTYVALSRVTSLEGLHLINFDPSSVIASQEAIIEYNRLKRIHKPKTEMIIIAKEHYHKVKDVLWALPKVVTSVQKSSLNHKVQCRSNSTAWIIYGFQNTDKVSCYANAVLQCLLHINVIRQQLFNCDKSDILRLLMHRYEIGMHNLNTYAIRQYLGEHFSSIRKHNAFDFLITLCEKYECIKNLMEHQITCTKRCKTCDYTKTIHNNNIIISIPINNLEKKNFNLNDLLNITFSHWYQSHNELCEYCTGNDIIYKNEITLTKEIIVIHLILFLSQNDKLMKTTSEFNLCAVPTTKVLIAGQSYKTMNAIFHHGSSINEGHYVSICREGKSSIWVEVDDMQI